VVRRNEHHTLGASVLASQLRRMGVAVRVSLCSPDEDVVAEARDGDYRMVAISSSSYESVYSLRDLVAKLQDVGDGGLKTAVGGSILRRDEDLRHVLGVDVATDDPVEAMVRCGLRSSLSPPPPTKGRTIASAARS
ncbi:MAG: cobalamin B12-binding domain-containing protein, partial [Pseudomonadota bacterium]